MDHTKFIVSNQKEESITIQTVKKSVRTFNISSHEIDEMRNNFSGQLNSIK